MRYKKLITKLDNSGNMIAGIGNALVDILSHESDDFVSRLIGAKGGMTYVDIDYSRRTLSQLKEKPKIVPGGAVCNTILGVGQLGGKARFVGKRGRDEFGNLFQDALVKSHVEPALFISSSPTGRVLSIITPDAQRTMFTFLGAASEMLPDEISDDCFNNTAIVFVEGYLLFNRDLIQAALKAAKRSGALIALDLASFTVVEESRDFLDGIVTDYVDILMANEDEARAFTGYSDEGKGLESLSRKVDIAVLKVGKRGSYIHHEGETMKIEAKGTGAAIDTTGAGDLWASGFLFGLVKGYPLDRCGELGSACGHEVCQVMGANIPEEGWQRIKRDF